MRATVAALTLSIALASHAGAQDRAHRFNDTAVSWGNSTTKLETRSVTYLLEGKEVTRYFETSRNDKGTIIFNEVDRPGGKHLTFTGQVLKSGSSAPLNARSHALSEATNPTPYDWCMSAFGYTRANAANESTSALSASTAEPIRPAVSKHDPAMVLGPDGEAYHATAEGGTARPTVPDKGPNGEAVRAVETWTQNERGWQKKVELNTRPKPTPAKARSTAKPEPTPEGTPVVPTPTKSPFLEIPKSPSR